MPPNWAQGHRIGAHCPGADCLISIRTDPGQDVCMEYTVDLVTFVTILIDAQIETFLTGRSLFQLEPESF